MSRSLESFRSGMIRKEKVKTFFTLTGTYNRLIDISLAFSIIFTDSQTVLLLFVRFQIWHL